MFPYLQDKLPLFTSSLTISYSLTVRKYFLFRPAGSRALPIIQSPYPILRGPLPHTDIPRPPGAPLTLSPFLPNPGSCTILLWNCSSLSVQTCWQEPYSVYMRERREREKKRKSTKDKVTITTIYMKEGAAYTRMIENEINKPLAQIPIVGEMYRAVTFPFLRWNGVKSSRRRAGRGPWGPPPLPSPSHHHHSLPLFLSLFLSCPADAEHFQDRQTAANHLGAASLLQTEWIPVKLWQPHVESEETDPEMFCHLSLKLTTWCEKN